MNLARVGLYRLGLRTGLHPVQKVRREIGGADFFAQPSASIDLPVPEVWRDNTFSFGWHKAPLPNDVPDWHRSPFDGNQAGGSDKPWWTLSDFDLPVGDIKTVWE
ncbi:heparinase, partial [bacterium]